MTQFVTVFVPLSYCAAGRRKRIFHFIHTNLLPKKKKYDSYLTEPIDFNIADILSVCKYII